MHNNYHDLDHYDWIFQVHWLKIIIYVVFGILLSGAVYSCFLCFLFAVIGGRRLLINCLLLKFKGIKGLLRWFWILERKMCISWCKIIYLTLWKLILLLKLWKEVLWEILCLIIWQLGSTLKDIIIQILMYTWNQLNLCIWNRIFLGAIPLCFE